MSVFTDVRNGLGMRDVQKALGSGGWSYPGRTLFVNIEEVGEKERGEESAAPGAERFT